MSLHDVAGAAGLSAEERALLAELLAEEGVELADEGGLRRRERAPGEGTPLSFAQERLWFLDRLLPGTAAYNVPAALRLAGRLDRRALAASLSEIARRHEALRTVFAEVDGAPVAVARPAAPLPLPLADLAGLPPERAAAAARRLSREEAARGFDLARGPLLRCRLLRLGEAEHWLLLTVHHIASDGWSTGVFVRELAALYPALAAGRPSPLPELPVQYADYAAWQRESLAGEALAAELGHWRRALAGLATADLPADRPRPARPSFRGAVHAERLAAGAALAELGRRQGATPFMALLAALWTLLARLTGREDVAVGTAVAGRGRPEVEGLIGFFVNTLVLRGAVAEGTTFRALLAQSRDVALDAFAHQELPFERIVEELQPERDPSRTPIFQTIFSVQSFRPPAAPLPGLAVEAVEAADAAAGIAKFDLAATFGEPGPDGVMGAWTYRRELYDGTTVARWAGQLAVLAAAAAADSDRPALDLPLLAPAERAAVAVEWSGFPTPYPREETIPALFAREAARRPAAVAVVDAKTGLRWTYGELAARAGRLARHLVRHLAQAGVGPEVPVGLFLERSAVAIAAMIGIVQAGGAYVPLDPALPIERLAWLLQDTGTPVVVTRRDLLAELPDARGRWRAIAVDDEEDADDGPAPPLAAPLPESLAYVTYTSGSTGEPKGVAVVHRGVVRLVRDTNYVRLGEDEVILELAPIAFDASTFEIWGALLHGGRVVVAPPGVLSLAELQALIAGHGVTAMFMTTALFHAAVDAGLDALRPLRQLIMGGEAMSPPRMARARAELAGARLVHAYGPTENTTFTTCDDVGGMGAVDPGRTVPIGGPIANTRVHLLDRALRPVPIGAAGELYAGGDGLARGYFRRPAATAERFVPDPLGEPGGRLYRTGDLARFLADGRIDFLARLDAQVKIRGFRIEPGEVESALARHPDVSEAAVVVASEGGERRLVAYCTARRPGLQAADLARFLRQKLPEYMVPAAFAVVAALPLTPAGKVDRRALAARPLGEAGARPASRAPRAEDLSRSPVPELLAGLFAALLGRGEVSVDDDFFALGGHSLLATRAIARLREALGVELPVAALFEHPTPAGLAEAVAAARAAGRPAPPPLAPARRKGDLPLSFAQERLWFIDRLQPGNPAYNLPLALDCDGALDAGALARALAALAARHEALRTRFDVVDGTPVQAIDPPGGLALPSIDLAALPPARRDEEAARLVAAESWRPFDLARGPLARARLLRLADDRHAIVLALHHAIADGWSLGVLVRDLSALYQEALGQALGGGPADLPALPVQYADYAVWQRGWLAGEVLQGELAYWRERLTGAPPLLELPTDRPRPPVASWRGAIRPARLGPALSAEIRAISRQAGATPFMVLAAGFLALLGRTSGQEDVTLGVPIAGRTHVETEELVGFFVNTLVLRAALPGGVAFGRLVERVRADALAAYEHQEVPFERLVEELKVERSLAHSPLFQAMFALQNAPVGDLALPGLRLRPRAAPGSVAKFDLTFTLSEGDEGFGGALSYATALFDATTIDRLLASFSTLLSAAAADPERPLGELPLLGERERHQAIREWNDTAVPPPIEDIEDVVARFVAHARSAPAAPAIEAGGRTVSYGELAGWAGSLAAQLAALGVGVESRVAVLAERTAATVAGYLAVLALGGAYAALDPQQPEERLLGMLEDAWQGSAAPVLLARRALAAGLAERLAASGAVLVDPEEEIGPAPFDPVAVPESAAAYVIFTSGSTGRPKGVVVSRGALGNLVGWHLATYSMTAADRATLLAGTGFDASVWEIWPALAAGAALAAPDGETRRTPARLVAWLAAERISLAFLPTPLAEAVLAEIALAEPWPAGAPLRALLTGGDRLHEGPPPGLPFRLVNHYGPTESAVVSTAGAVASDAAGALLPSIGRPIANLAVRLLSPFGEPAPVGVAAELGVAGASLARGYLGDPARTAERFVPDPLAASPGERLYRTGDLARHLPDGRLELLGRGDGQVKIRGIRVELGEVEAALAAHPAVAAAAVAVRGEGAAARLAAYVVPRAGGLDAGALRRWAKGRLPAAMVPAAFVELPAMPLTANGKVDRAALPEPAAAGLPEGDFVPPQNAMEEILAGIWSELLEVPRVGAHDSFFDLGGHSLQAVRLTSRIRETLGVDLPVSAVFEAPTLAELAAHVAAEMMRSLQEGGLGEVAAAPAPQPAEPPLARLLADLFAGLLGRAEVSLDDDFFALGGHSLLAIRLIARLREVLGVELPVAALFENPTPADLAEVVDAARAAGRPLGEVERPPLVRAPREGDLPLSFAQERLWLIDRLQPGSPAYNLPLALDCDGALDAGALARALAALAARHEALRTRFEAVEGSPVQRIDPPGGLALPSIDLAALPPALREAEASRLLAAESWRPFDLARGPLARVRLLRLAADRHAILLALHHSIADGWSLGVLVRDLSALYQEALGEALGGGPADLPELPVQYADYAVWQRGWLAGEVLAAELAYWRERLAGAPPLLALPADRPRPPVASWRGGLRPARLGPALSADLRALGWRTGATPFMVLAAGFLALLGRYANQEDVTLGTPIAGRTHVETEELVGFFVNTLVLRAALPGGVAFGRLVERVRADALAAYEHQEVPFERLVEELKVERSLAHSPLFQAMFALQNAPVGDLALPGLRLRPRQAPGSVAKFDLTFTLSEGEEGFGGALSYAATLFDATTIDRLLASFSTLLSAAAADPERPLGELPLLGEGERHQAIREWNDTAALAGEDVLARFAAHARSVPAAPAVEAGGSTVSYGELAGWAGSLAARLAALGVGVESRVAVLAERTAATVAGYLAVLALGGAYAALDPEQPEERLLGMLEDAWQGSAAPVLLARRALAGGLAERLAACLAASGAVLVDPEEGVGAAPFLPVAVPDSAAAYVIFTSGSTGRPKGVVVSRGALGNLVEWHLATYMMTAADRATLLAGTGFDASVWEIWPALAAGAAFVAPDEETRRTPARLVGWLAAERISLAFLPTPLAEAVLSEIRLAEPWPAGAPLRALLIGGDRLHEGPPPGLPFRLVNHYGPTESAVVSTAGEVASDTAGALLPSIGRPIANLAVRLLSPFGEPAPVGVAAELGVAGASLARGYLGDPARTAERFVPDPLAASPGERLYRTGDLARHLPDGRLEFLGRGDGQVKIRGIRVELGEVEAALAAHPAVAAAAVAVRGADPSARLAAYVVPRAGGLDAGALRRWAKERLPAAMVPAAFVELPALPLTANGKVDRAALPEPAVSAAMVGGGGAHVPPRNAMEEILAGIWSELLGCPRVGAHDSFFDLGGHSLQAVRLTSRIRETLGVELPVSAVFEAPTLAELAAAVAAEMERRLE